MRKPREKVISRDRLEALGASPQRLAPALLDTILELRRPLLPRYAGHPEPGWFRLRLVRRGVWVAALIWRPCPWVNPEVALDTPGEDEWCRPAERSRPLRAVIHGGAQGSDWEVDPMEVWERGNPI